MQWLLCQYMYSWGKTDVQAIDSIGQPITDILGNLLSDYTADTEDTKDTCFCVKLYCK